MSRLDGLREDLAILRRRFAKGEIGRSEYDEFRAAILEDATPEEREALGTSKQAPGTGATPAPASGTPGPFGPTGGSGSGVRTTIPSLADLTLVPGVELLGQWRITRELGRGGFGAVFEAEEMHLGETQAVKVLDPAMVAREELLARFRREVQVMRRLVHPHIVRVYDYRETLDEHLALISMEYVPGGTVKDLMSLSRESGERVPVILALRILAQVLDALVEAHDQEVVHRDVTPGNILLAGASARELLEDPTQNPRAKLVDFGIAGLVERSELSQKSRVLGTAAYVAPEVLDPSAPVTPAADVYGLGAVVYELLTGTAPLGRFRDPSEIRSELGQEVDDFLLAILDPQPENRLGTSDARTRALAVLATSEACEQGAVQTAQEARALDEAVDAESEERVKELLASLGNEPLATEAVTCARNWLQERRTEREQRDLEKGRRAEGQARPEAVRWNDEARRKKEEHEEERRSKEEIDGPVEKGVEGETKNKTLAWLFIAAVSVLLVVVWISSRQSQLTGSSAESRMQGESSFDKDAWDELQKLKSELDKKRASREQLLERTPEGLAGFESRSDRTEAREQIDRLTVEIDSLTEQLARELPEFMNESFEIPLGPEGHVDEAALTPVQREAIEMKVDVDIILAREYITEGGEYEEALNIYEQALVLAPGYEPLLRAKSEAEENRYMSEERFSKVEVGMTSTEVREALGQVMRSNVRDYDGKGIRGWFYRREDGGAAGVFFKEEARGAGNWVVYSCDYRAVEPQIVPVEGEESR